MPSRFSISASALREVVETLRRGGLIAFPTETAYGLGADATHAGAVSRVFAIKGRDPQKTVPLIAASTAMVERYATLSGQLRRLACQYWPGPLTLVLPVRQNVPSGMRPLAKGVIRSDSTIAIRVSSHPAARALSYRLNAPLVSTSANCFGHPACYSARAVEREFAGHPWQLDFLLDAGALPRRKLSTIIREREGKIVILRPGSVHVPGAVQESDLILRSTPPDRASPREDGPSAARQVPRV